MKRKMMFLMLTLMVLSAASVKSQVTIGSGNEPHAGAVLDLQSNTQGLKLPNVALSNDLTQFVLPEEGTFTKSNATGMLVFNTNTDVGAGVYVWSGTEWISAGNEHGAYGPNPVVGSNTYRTYIYPGNIGTRMLTPSKEGTPDFTTYPGQTEGERGYYYKKEHYASACPTGWHLPSVAEWTLRMAYLTSNASFREYDHFNEDTRLPSYVASASKGLDWGSRALYATTQFPAFVDFRTLAGTVFSSSLNGDWGISVVCVKNQ